MSLLDAIQSPKDLKKLSVKEMHVLAEEIREVVLNTTAQKGGHVGPNLGVVELTIALHRIFSTPDDQFVFDVAHQGYVHKLLTGRKGERFENIRHTGGVSGFLCRDESPHDAFGAGHAGTALSAALGIAKARDLAKKKDHVVALIGDASLTCGITMEAMNNIAHTTSRLTIILNDNEWSIARNVGSLAHSFSEFITKPFYNKANQKIARFLKSLPYGQQIHRFASKVKQELKDFILPSPSGFFETYGVRYIGPVDGHNLPELLHYLEFCKRAEEPILLHVLTQKGRGFPGALQNPEKFHGTGPFDRATGQSVAAATGTPPAYQDVFGQVLLKEAQFNPKILAITAAMPSGTGLTPFVKALPGQFFDVGIAEEHAVVFAAGLATQGFKPVCAIYSTFLQRAFDPIIHDVCLQNLPVFFAMDRAGVSPNDGPTHHGLFDIAYLKSIPNACLMQPKDEAELQDMLHTGLQHPGPIFMRYPRGAGEGVPLKAAPQSLPIGKAEVLQEGLDLQIWAIGPMVAMAMRLAPQIENALGIRVGVVNARFMKPLDRELLMEQAAHAKGFVTLEDHAVTGGFGSILLEALSDRGCVKPLLRIGWPDAFIPHGSSVKHLREQAGLYEGEIYKKILAFWPKCMEL
jgi:1-deoxy-D-xylulose-5-phosphate synthase